LGCKVVAEGGVPDGLFAHAPEPTAENLAGLLPQIVAAGADVGFFQDPDADRLAIATAAGRYIGEEATLALAVEAVLRKTPGPIVVNCSTSGMAAAIATPPSVRPAGFHPEGQLDDVTHTNTAATKMASVTQPAGRTGGRSSRRRGGRALPSAGRIRTLAAFKEAGAKAPKISARMAGEWNSDSAERTHLPPARDLGSLYRELLRPLMPLTPRPGESLSEALDRIEQARSLEREVEALKRKLAKEPQLNRKLDIRRELMKRTAEYEALVAAVTE
jgi:hypothetical protein